MGPRPEGGTPGVTSPNNKSYGSGLAPEQALPPGSALQAAFPYGAARWQGLKWEKVDPGEERWPPWKRLFLPWQARRQVSRGFE